MECSTHAQRLRSAHPHQRPRLRSSGPISTWTRSETRDHCGQEGVQGVMAGVSGSGAESSGREAGSSCLQFGVRSYLHHFYEGCSSPARREKDPEDRRRARRPRSTLWWKSPVWKVYLALGLPVLTAGIAILSVGYSTPHRIESFGEGDLFFVDPQAVSFNRGLRLSAAAGIGLSCLGSALAAMGLVFLVLPGASLKERLFHGPREGGPERRVWLQTEETPKGSQGCGH